MGELTLGAAFDSEADSDKTAPGLDQDVPRLWIDVCLPEI
jgi:hypothetical protein